MDSLVYKLATETPWGIVPSYLATLREILRRHIAGERLTAEEIQQRIGALRRNDDTVRANVGNIAVLAVRGTIVPRASLLTETSGVTSVDSLTARFREVASDTNVGAIVLDVDSPGGMVNGIDELSAEIAKARAEKPVYAIANHLAASAAYWLASAASEISVTPSGEVGSIGVYAVHEDVSKAAETAGVRTTLISAGKYKVEGNPFEPLTEEARTAMQSRVNDYYDMFVSRVARNRGVGTDAVRNGYGEGRVLGARDALAAGMVDNVETMDELMKRAAKKMKKNQMMNGQRAELDYRQRRARALSQ